MSKSKRHGPLPGCPSRQDMISASVFMEQRGFTYREWSIMASLCDSDVEIRQYILAFAKECLDAWNGLAPSRGRFSYEIAAIAASNAYANARKEMRNYPKEYIGKLMEPPVPWSKEQTEEKMEAYFKNHPRRWRMTANLHDALELEAAAIYCEPYTTPSGCVIIPFKAAETVGKVVPQ